MKSKFSLFFITYLLCFIFIVVGALLKIFHIQAFNTELILIIGLLSNFIYIIIGIVEVSKSSKLTTNKKALWNLCFILTPAITGLFYLLNGRKRIV
jgi:hypothetical protein